MTEFSVDQYDQKIMNAGIQRLYEHSGYYNVGDWSNQPKSVAIACQALVKKHCIPLETGASDPFILDAGCGLGAGTQLIGQNYTNGRVIGINISPKQIEHARSKNTTDNVTFEVRDAVRPGFAADTFDHIISVEAAFHFDTRQEFISNAFTILKPGGTLTFTDILFNSTEAVGDWSVPHANRTLDVEEFNRLCTSPGFRLTAQEDITDIAWRGFCNYVGKFPGMKLMAEKLAPSVAYYLITHLKKP